MKVSKLNSADTENVVIVIDIVRNNRIQQIARLHQKPIIRTTKNNKLMMKYLHSELVLGPVVVGVRPTVYFASRRYLPDTLE